MARGRTKRQEPDVGVANRVMQATDPPRFSAGAKVSVALNLEVAWLDLEVTKMVDKDQPTPAGMRTIKEAVRTGKFIRLRGTAYPRGGQTPEGFTPPPFLVGGFSITRGIDKEMWDAWLKANWDAAIVKNRLIFAYERPDQVRGAIQDAGDIRSDIAPLDPRTDDNGRSMDPRGPKKTMLGVHDVQSANLQDMMGEDF